MTRGETSSEFKSPNNMSADEQLTFDFWVSNNAAIASIFVVRLLAIVVIGPSRPGAMRSAAVDITKLTGQIPAGGSGGSFHKALVAAEKPSSDHDSFAELSGIERSK